MDDMTDKINAILGDPQMLKKIKDLSGLLGKIPNKSVDEKDNDDNNEFEPTIKNKTDDISDDMMQTFVKLAPIISSMNKDDKNTKFLYALKPLLGKKRQKKIDEAIRMMRMIKLLPIIKSKEFF